MTFDGIDLFTMSREDRERLRGGELGLIFQEPMTRLNPLMRIADQFEETIEQHESKPHDADVRQRSLDTLGRMGIPPTVTAVPARVLGRDAAAAMIALALVLRPSLVVADEPTTSLDVLVEAQIIQMLTPTCGELRDGAAADHAQPRDRR